MSTIEPISDRARAALLIVAHPDDETLGAASLLFRRGRCRLIHVTDGAPRDPRFRSPSARYPGRDDHPARSREHYARTRRAELLAALALAGLSSECATSFGVPDMEAATCLGAIARRLAAAITWLRPGVIVTHDYAGGHPDHDAVAWAVAGACMLLLRRGLQPPVVYEMPLYHGQGGALRVGEFVRPCDAAEPIVFALSEAEHRRKRLMLDAFISQRETLRCFEELMIERFRPIAPNLDCFTRAPHAGQLLYERWGFPITGDRWRALALRATRRLACDEARAHG